MNKEVNKRLRDALAACYAIQSFIAGQTLSSYVTNLMVRSAVERQFEIVGEALHRAEITDETVVDVVPDLRRIVGLRNRIIHGYDQVDHGIVWAIVSDDLLELMAHLEAVVAE